MANLLKKVYIPVSILIIELAARCQMTEYPFFSKQLLYVALFSLAFGFLLCALKPLTTVLFGAASLCLCIQCVYRTIFNTYATIASVSGAGNAIGSYWRETVQGVFKTWQLIPIIALFVIWLIIKKDYFKRLVSFAAFAVFQLAAVICVLLSTSGVMSPAYIYNNVFIPKVCAGNFGIITTLRLDLKNILVSHESEPVVSPTPSADFSAFSVKDNLSPQTTPEIVEYNVLDIDFDSLIQSSSNSVVKNLHKYFKKEEPTEKNDKTGIFKGKNLIWICAEAFSPWALDDNHTPTLSKLSREGFVFENFYNPLWDVSTSDGEYVISTSLLPKTGTWSFSVSGTRLMPFSMPHMLEPFGYQAYAYHNYNYDYYGRNYSYPNLGYKYKGYGNGLNVTPLWPASDLEMMELSCGDYIDSDQPFVVWYMTVSGHLHYTYNGNYMVRKHYDEISDLLESGMPEESAGYIGAQMEFDSAVRYIIDELEKHKLLEDTVIVISGDHYPYGLSLDEIAALNGGPVEDENFELYHSSLIIWNPEIKTESVEKYCCSLDILPTLLNLFGLDYDSRLLMGKDIFSSAEPLIPFNNRSWISCYGRYNSLTDEYSGVSPYENYAADTTEKVNQLFSVSADILDKDYYRKCFEHE